MAPASSCLLNAQFAPIAVASFTENLTFPSSAANATSTRAVLTGTGVSLTRSTLTVTLTSPATGSVSYGQSAVFSATILPTKTTTPLTVTLVIRVDGSASQTVNVAGPTTPFTLTLSPGIHTLSVTYTGDNVYASSFGTYSLTVVKEASATALANTTVTQTASPSLTLTAKVTGTISGTPTGSVQFFNGTTLIGQATLSSQGIATLTTTKVAYSAFAFTSVYSGDANYAASTSPAVTLSGDYGITALTSQLSTAAGIAVSTTVTVTPYFGYTGNVTFTCAGLPANAACRFTPQTLSLSGGAAQSTSIQFFTNLPPTLVSQQRRSLTALFACITCPFMLLGFVGHRRFRNFGRLAALVLALGGLASLSGCSQSDAFKPNATPAGTSTIVMTAMDSTGVAHTATFTLNITTN